MIVRNDIAIKICMGPAGIAAGGKAVLEAFRQELSRSDIPATLQDKCSSHQVGCLGLCARDVLVKVFINGDKTIYQYVKPGMVERIVAEHIIGGTPVQEWLVDEAYENFYKKQVKVVLADVGRVDPEDINDYIRTGGYESAREMLLERSPLDVIAEIKASGLRGRGGAGFLTGLKWELARMSGEKDKYIICNADEGDPGAFMDRAVIEGNPHSVIEGMIIGAFAVGAEKGYVYIRAEYPLAVERLKSAINQAYEAGYLGKEIFRTPVNFDVKIKLGAGAFVCGEETALIASIEGERGMPRPKPPFPVNKGLWQQPTVINNVETLANIPYIIRNGCGWYASYGTESSRGTKVFALTGKIKNTGLIEVPMGIPLKDIIYDIGGGIEGGKALKAVQTGGPSGGCIPADMLDLKVDYESLSRAGSIVGSGGMIVLDEDDCMVNMAKYFIQFTQAESCGKCVPCRVGTKRLLEMLDRITKGHGKEGDIERLERMCTGIKTSSLCGLGQTAPNPVLSTLKHFREEYEAHIRDKKCPAKACKELLTYRIREDLCKGCGACLKACPSGAITGEKKKPHKIYSDICIRCGACFEVCKFNSVERE
ncbi:MAG: NADH-quinone oxidoreductase subunit NuoF [Nitrospirae bacterium]|nr:NADH-quinone oxidoreductase subunit NuoF [Nitrospirota bacterium]